MLNASNTDNQTLAISPFNIKLADGTISPISKNNITTVCEIYIFPTSATFNQIDVEQLNPIFEKPKSFDSITEYINEYSNYKKFTTNVTFSYDNTTQERNISFVETNRSFGPIKNLPEYYFAVLKFKEVSSPSSKTYTESEFKNSDLLITLTPEKTMDLIILTKVTNKVGLTDLNLYPKSSNELLNRKTLKKEWTNDNYYEILPNDLNVDNRTDIPITYDATVSYLDNTKTMIINDEFSVLVNTFDTCYISWKLTNYLKHLLYCELEIVDPITTGTPELKLIRNSNTPNATLEAKGFAGTTEFLLNGDTVDNAHNHLTVTDYSVNIGGLGTITPPATSSCYVKDGGFYVPSSANLALGTGDFTIETFVNMQTFGSDGYETHIMCLGTSNSSVSYGIEITPTMIALDWGSNNWAWVGKVQVAYNIKLNNWYHLVIQRKASKIQIFVNGQQLCDTTNTYNFKTSGNMYFGSYFGTRTNPDYYLAGFRIIKGQALYDTNMIIPTTNFTNISGTVLLINNGLREEIGGRMTVTAASTVATNTVTNGSIHYNNTSLFFNGVNSVLEVSASTFDFSNDFTIECWFNMSTIIANSTIFTTSRQLTTNNLRLTTGSSGNILTVILGNNTVLITSNTSIIINKWNHVAICRENGTLKLYLNGIMVGSRANDVTFSKNTFQIGADQYGFFNGYIEDFRIFSGGAIYNANFTPPTTKLTNLNVVNNISLFNLLNNPVGTRYRFAINSQTGTYVAIRNTGGVGNEITGTLEGIGPIHLCASLKGNTSYSSIKLCAHPSEFKYPLYTNCYPWIDGKRIESKNNNKIINNLPLFVDPTYTGTENYTQSYDIVNHTATITSTGQFSNAAWRLDGFGKRYIYFEVQIIDAGASNVGCYMGIKKDPIGAIGNGVLHDFAYSPGIGIYRITVDTELGIFNICDINGTILKTYTSGPGRLYFTLNDGTSSTGGQGKLKASKKSFTYTVMAGFEPWIIPEDTPNDPLIENPIIDQNQIILVKNEKLMVSTFMKNRINNSASFDIDCDYYINNTAYITKPNYINFEIDRNIYIFGDVYRKELNTSKKLLYPKKSNTLLVAKFDNVTLGKFEEINHNINIGDLQLLKVNSYNRSLYVGGLDSTEEPGKQISKLFSILIDGSNRPNTSNEIILPLYDYTDPVTKMLTQKSTKYYEIVNIIPLNDRLYILLNDGTGNCIFYSGLISNDGSIGEWVKEFTTSMLNISKNYLVDANYLYFYNNKNIIKFNIVNFKIFPGEQTLDVSGKVSSTFGNPIFIAFESFIHIYNDADSTYLRIRLNGEPFVVTNSEIPIKINKGHGDKSLDNVDYDLTQYEKIDIIRNPIIYNKFDGTDNKFNSTKNLGCLQFTGASYITSSTSNLLAFTGNFTVEAWVKPTSTDLMGIFTTATGATTGLMLTTKYAKLGNNTLNEQKIDFNLDIDKWSHVAYTRKNNIYYLHINGKLISSDSTQTNTISLSTTYFVIGRLLIDSTLNYFNGSLGSIRVSNDAQYDENNFIPSNKKYLFNNSIFILEEDVVDIIKVFSLTTSGQQIAKINDKTFPVTTNDINFSSSSEVSYNHSIGFNSGYLSYVSGTAYNFDAWTSFTLETWIKFDTINALNYICDGGTNNSFALYYDKTAKAFKYIIQNVGSLLTYSFDAIVGQWYHLAMVHDGSVHKLYFNGTLVASNGWVAGIATGGTLNIGISGNLTAANGLVGSIRNFRISNIKRYTATFTPDFSNYNIDLNTLFLLVNNITEASGKTLTKTGNVFILADPNSNTNFLVCDGKSYITSPKVNELQFGTDKDFTIESWVKYDSLPSYACLFDGSMINNVAFRTVSTTGFQFVLNNVVALASYTTIVTNTWYHFAVSRSGSTIRMFINGIKVAESNANFGNVNFEGLTIGRSGQTNTYWFTGKFYNFRISNISLYSTNFTPETNIYKTNTNTLFLIGGKVIEETGKALINVGIIPSPNPDLIGRENSDLVINYDEDTIYNEKALLLDSANLRSNLLCSLPVTQSMWIKIPMFKDIFIISQLLTDAGIGLTLFGNLTGNIIYKASDNINLWKSTNTLLENTWYHIALRVITPTNFEIFINGEKVIFTSMTNDNFISDFGHAIGSSYYGNNFNPIKVSNYKLFDLYLSENEILSLYSETGNKVEKYQPSNIILPENLYQDNDLAITTLTSNYTDGSILPSTTVYSGTIGTETKQDVFENWYNIEHTTTSASARYFTLPSLSYIYFEVNIKYSESNLGGPIFGIATACTSTSTSVNLKNNGSSVVYTPMIARKENYRIRIANQTLYVDDIKIGYLASAAYFVVGNWNTSLGTKYNIKLIFNECDFQYDVPNGYKPWKFARRLVAANLSYPGVNLLNTGKYIYLFQNGKTDYAYISDTGKISQFLSASNVHILLTSNQSIHRIKNYAYFFMNSTQIYRAEIDITGKLVSAPTLYKTLSVNLSGSNIIVTEKYVFAVGGIYQYDSIAILEITDTFDLNLVEVKVYKNIGITNGLIEKVDNKIYILCGMYSEKYYKAPNNIFNDGSELSAITFDSTYVTDIDISKPENFTITYDPNYDKILYDPLISKISTTDATILNSGVDGILPITCQTFGQTSITTQYPLNWYYEYENWSYNEFIYTGPASNIQFGTNNFCIETYLYTMSNYRFMFKGGNNYRLYIDTNQISIYYIYGGVTTNIRTKAFAGTNFNNSINSVHHFVLQRINNITQIFIDGLLFDEFEDPTNYIMTGETSFMDFTGKLGYFRLTNGNTNFKVKDNKIKYRRKAYSNDVAFASSSAYRRVGTGTSAYITTNSAVQLTAQIPDAFTVSLDFACPTLTMATTADCLLALQPSNLDCTLYVRKSNIYLIFSNGKGINLNVGMNFTNANNNIIVSFDGTTLSAYFNKTLLASSSTLTTMTYNTDIKRGNINIGLMSVQSGYRSNDVYFSNFRIFDKALTQLEVNTVYDNTNKDLRDILNDGSCSLHMDMDGNFDIDADNSIFKNSIVAIKNINLVKTPNTFKEYDVLTSGKFNGNSLIKHNLMLSYDPKFDKIKNEITLSIFINPEVINGKTKIYDFGDGRCIYIDQIDSKNILCVQSSLFGVSICEIPLATWSHILVNYKDIDIYEIYFNGVLQDKVNNPKNILVSTINIIGNDIDENHILNNTVGYVGLIDTIRIFNRTITESEVSTLYNEWGKTNQRKSYPNDKIVTIELNEDNLPSQVNTIFATNSYPSTTYSGYDYRPVGGKINSNIIIDTGNNRIDYYDTVSNSFKFINSPTTTKFRYGSLTFIKDNLYIFPGWIYSSFASIQDTIRCKLPGFKSQKTIELENFGPISASTTDIFSTNQYVLTVKPYNDPITRLANPKAGISLNGKFKWYNLENVSKSYTTTGYVNKNAPKILNLPNKRPLVDNTINKILADPKVTTLIDAFNEKFDKLNFNSIEFPLEKEIEYSKCFGTPIYIGLEDQQSWQTTYGFTGISPATFLFGGSLPKQTTSKFIYDSSILETTDSKEFNLDFELNGTYNHFSIEIPTIHSDSMINISLFDNITSVWDLIDTSDLNTKHLIKNSAKKYSKIKIEYVGKHAVPSVILHYTKQAGQIVPSELLVQSLLSNDIDTIKLLAQYTGIPSALYSDLKDSDVAIGINANYVNTGEKLRFKTASKLVKDSKVKPVLKDKKLIIFNMEDRVITGDDLPTSYKNPLTNPICQYTSRPVETNNIQRPSIVQIIIPFGSMILDGINFLDKDGNKINIISKTLGSNTDKYFNVGGTYEYWYYALDRDYRTYNIQQLSYRNAKYNMYDNQNHNFEIQYYGTEEIFANYKYKTTNLSTDTTGVYANINYYGGFNPTSTGHLTSKLLVTNVVDKTGITGTLGIQPDTGALGKFVTINIPAGLVYGINLERRPEQGTESNIEYDKHLSIKFDNNDLFYPGRTWVKNSKIMDSSENNMIKNFNDRYIAKIIYSEVEMSINENDKDIKPVLKDLTFAKGIDLDFSYKLDQEF